MEKLASYPKAKQELAQIRNSTQWQTLHEAIFVHALGFESGPRFDFRRMFSDPALAQLAGAMLWRIARHFSPNALIGPGFGAAPLLYATAFSALKDGVVLPVLMVRDKRKAHNQKLWIEGIRQPCGTKAILIDDFMESGSALPLVERAMAADNHDLEIQAIGLFFDMWEPTGSRQIESSRFPVMALFTRHDVGLSRDCFDAKPPLMKGDYANFVESKPLWWHLRLNENLGYPLKCVPVVADNAVFVADDLSRVWRHSALTGDVHWCYESLAQPDKGIVQDLQYADGSVVFGCYDGTITRLNASNGEIIWRWKQDTSIHATPTLDLANNRLFINTEQWNSGEPYGNLIAMNWHTGRLMWQRPHAWWPPGTPAYCAKSDVVIASCNDQTICAVRAADGVLLWRRPTKGLVRGKPAIARTLVIAATERGELTAYDISTGEVSWSRRYGVGSMHQFPKIVQSGERTLVITLDANCHLVAFDIVNGDIRWMSRLRSAGTWWPIECGDYLAVLSHNGHLAVFNTALRLKVWEGSIGGIYKQPPAIGLVAESPNSSKLVLAAASNTDGLKVFEIHSDYLTEPLHKAVSNEGNSKVQAPNTGSVVRLQTLLHYRRNVPNYFIDRREALIEAASRKSFTSKILRFTLTDKNAFAMIAKQGMPFVVTGLVSQWPISKFGPKELIEAFGENKVCARVTDYIEKGFSDTRSFESGNLKGYFDLLKTPPQGDPPYAGNQSLENFDQYCKWPDFIESPAATKVWLGPEGTVTPLHADYDDNLFAQIVGSKRFVLYPPHAAIALQTYEANPALHGSRFDPEKPDFESHPIAKQWVPIECELTAGDLLFLPAGWFHHVRAKNFSLSANRWSYGAPYALQSAVYRSKR
jgi:outer membrane protein assembly factor BamB/orotate phosphoribosyltransferase